MENINEGLKALGQGIGWGGFWIGLAIVIAFA